MMAEISVFLPSAAKANVLGARDNGAVKVRLLIGSGNKAAVRVAQQLLRGKSLDEMLVEDKSGSELISQNFWTQSAKH